MEKQEKKNKAEVMDQINKFIEANWDDFVSFLSLEHGIKIDEQKFDKYHDEIRKDYGLESIQF